MLTTRAPIGEIICFVHRHPNSVEKDKLRSQIENLIDLIISRTEKKGVDNASTSTQLLNEIFVLRLELLRSQEILDVLLGSVDQTIDELISRQLNTKPSFLDLEKAYVTALTIYKQITSTISDKIFSNDFNIEAIPTYSDLNNILKALPSKESHILSKYIKSSILLDYSLIASDLVFSGDLKLTSKERKKLISLLKSTIEYYGAYSNIFGLWKPSEVNESQWERNIKILSSRINSLINHNSLTTTTTKEFEKSLANN